MFFCKRRARVFTKYSLLIVCSIFFTLLTVGSGPMPYELQEVTAASAVSRVNVDYRLSMNLLRILNQKDSTNSIVSPLGMVNNLSILYVGSSGETRKQIAQLLGISGTPVEFLDQQRMRMDNVMKAGRKEGITFEYANIMLIDDTCCKLRKTFEKSLTDGKICKLEKIKYRHSGDAVARINEWCREKTHDHIKTIIESEDIKSKSSFGTIEEPFFTLLSAVYFKGDWLSRFDENTNNQFPFYCEAGASGEMIDMMEQKASQLEYGESGNIKILKMYFKGADFSLVVVLPDRIMSAKQLITEITPEEIAKASRNLLPHSVNVKMPKFDITNTIDLKPMMKNLGFPDMDDFTSMFEPTIAANTVYVEKMKQVNRFAVNEKGAEATSVTETYSFSVGCCVAPRMPSVDFIMDRPFLYFLQYENDDSGTVLFAGCYAKP